MAITQIAVLKLRRNYNNVELACNKHHVEALSKLEETEGFQKVAWSVSKEDASKLVWLIEWNKPPHAATPYMRDSEVILNRYCTFSVVPSQMINLDYPVLEVFQYVLAKCSTSSNNAEAMRLATKHWKAEGRPFCITQSFSHHTLHDASERNCVMVIPWQSKDEQASALMQGYFKKAMEEADPMREGILSISMEPIQWDAWKCQCVIM